MGEGCVEFGDGVVGIHDSDLGALEEGHDAVGGINVCVRVLDELFERGDWFAAFKTSSHTNTPLVHALQGTGVCVFAAPLVESVPADSDGGIDADEQEEGPFRDDFQIVLCPDVHGDKMLPPSLCDILCHFSHRLEPHIAVPLSVHIQYLDPIAQAIHVIVDGRRWRFKRIEGLVVLLVSRSVDVSQTQTDEAMLANEVLCNRPLASTDRACDANKHLRS